MTTNLEAKQQAMKTKQPNHSGPKPEVIDYDQARRRFAVYLYWKSHGDERTIKHFNIDREKFLRWKSRLFPLGPFAGG